MMAPRNCLVPLIGLVAASCSDKGQERPNILYVFPDQFRASAMAFWDRPEFAGAQRWKADPVVTPVLDRFAGESLVLTRAVSNCPLSSPYRGMFLTGMFPERNGIISNCMALRPDNTLDPDATCISDVLSASGYQCAYIGKLHADAPTRNDPANPGHFVSDRDPEWDAYTPPERRHGFEYWYSYGTFDQHKNPHYWDTEGVRHDPGVFSVQHESDKAVEFLRSRDKKRPFFLCVAYNPPHSPYLRPQEDCLIQDYAHYAGMGLDELYVRPNADTTMAKAPSARIYFANVTAVDRGFGRILQELKRQGLDRNTIVVFTADHGETMCSHSTEDPKNSIWTESFNVPFLIRWPGHVPPAVDSLLLSTVDIMPTLLTMAGLEVPQSVEGHDRSSIFLGRGGERPSAALYLRNVNGDPDPDGLYRHFFPVARGVKTDRYTFEIALCRDYTVDTVSIYDDWVDPYQMHCLDWRENGPLLRSLLDILAEKLRESDDVWQRDGILDRVAAQLHPLCSTADCSTGRQAL